jgi:hypothetical protein
VFGGRIVIETTSAIDPVVYLAYSARVLHGSLKVCVLLFLLLLLLLLLLYVCLVCLLFSNIIVVFGYQHILLYARIQIR